jgi:cytochrome c peroxidase
MSRWRFLSVVALWVTSAAVVLLPAQEPWYDWNLPKGFPAPPIPADNPITPARVELGRHLFYDTRLSGNGKAPTLRNVAVTAPYMHDGSVATLEDAIDHYAAGGRTMAGGPYRGVGRDNPNKSASIRGFAITSAGRADLVAFLQSLTGRALLDDPRFANPWPDPRTRGAR